MRRLTKDILISVLLVVGAVVCIVRWQAWFGMPEEPFWPNENKDYTFPGPEITNPKSELTLF